MVLAVGLARGRQSTMRSGQVYAPIVLLGGLIAVVAMEHALLTHDFSLAYVADNNSRATPWLYSITGLWSALAGSILLWGVVLGGYATAMVWRFRRRSGDELVAWATLVVYVVAAFFFGLMLGPADPFTARRRCHPHQRPRARTRCSRTTRWSSSTRPCSTSAWSASPCPSPSPSPH